MRAVTDVPVSTYRLQFTPTFRFDDARAIVPYLADLGVGYLYASPYLKAKPGSQHGYDVVDPNLLNPEIGTVAEHAALVAASQARGLGHLLDFVPNHMGIGPENPWWQDVLEWGEASPFGGYFDIDWRPLRTEMRGRVLLPQLGDYYGRVLERGELSLAFDAGNGAFQVAYFDNRFPLATKSYAAILDVAARMRRGHAWSLRALAAEFADASRERAIELKAELSDAARDAENVSAIEAALATFAIDAGPGAIDRLDAVLQVQSYRLAYWRVSADEINYRRFFDINDLAGVRVEDAEVLAQTHRLVFELIESGLVQGLRIDHVDGLYNPAGYCQLLMDRAAALGHAQYLVVEKILAWGEALHADWRIAGTTGYDFMNLVNGIFVDTRNAGAFERTYRRFASITGNFAGFAYRAKKDIMRSSLASEFEVLVTMLDRLAELDRRSNDYTYNTLHEALGEVVAAFPVYRTYVTSEDVGEEDRSYFKEALRLARRRSELGDERVFDFIESLLSMRANEISSNYPRNDVLRFAMKFQQYTSPVMAKAVEDTAFYRYLRLISLNEVGGDPRRFGTSIVDFHLANAERGLTFPHAMLATATHDHKRGEDTRTRIDALSEMPQVWSAALNAWSDLNAHHKPDVDGSAAPTDNDEYFIYQTLLGTWPMRWLDAETLAESDRAAYVERLDEYFVKALREAKFRTSWTNPSEAYEKAALGFVRGVLGDGTLSPFLADFQKLALTCARIGAVSSLAQTTLKLTVPGVPDTYQGCELWDLTLVDPDNRRPVDYAFRHDAIREMAAAVERGEIAELARDLLATWRDGRIKLFVTWRLLHLRRERPELFLGNAYAPLETTGTNAESIVAFAREDVVVVAPRIVRGLIGEDDALHLSFENEAVRLPVHAAAAYVDRLTGRRIAARQDEAGTYLAASDLFAILPTAVVLAEPRTQN